MNDANLLRAARETIAPSPGTVTDRFEVGSTQDIITVILEADKLAPPYTRRFAPHVQGGTVHETCERLHAFVQDNITYREDRRGIQDIKSPGQLFDSGFGDCKSFSVFTASVLCNLGIPYRYRFAAFGRGKDVTHVYVVAFDEAGAEIPIDAVPPMAFTEEPRSTYTIDYDPATGARIGQASTDTNAAAPQKGIPLALLALLGLGLLFTTATR